MQVAMVYNGRSSGRYEAGGYGAGGGGYPRRDSSLRRSGGSTFGAIDLGGGSGRQQYSGPSVSPWASGQGPNRHSWGGGGAPAFDRRDTFVSPPRGRATFRGRASTRSRPFSRGAATAGRGAAKSAADKQSVGKKKEGKKGVKTTQEAIDEAKAAALEKQMEASGDGTKGAGGAELLVKKEDGGAAAATEDGDKAAEVATADGKEGDAAAAAGKEGEAKPADAKKPNDAKKSTGKAAAKLQRERILSEYLNCSVCNVSNMGSESSFNEHVRGRKHQLMMELMEQKLEQSAKLIRVEIQMASKRAELELQRRNLKAGLAQPKEQGYCGMCNVRVYLDINEHRAKDSLHAKLKKFLHPRCCNMGFDTPVLYEKHLLSFTHFRKTQQVDKENAAAGTGAVVVVGDVPPPDPAAAAAPDGESATKENGEAADGAEAAIEEKPEEVPVAYDETVAVGVRTGQPFAGTYCPACRIATPPEHWLEHCRGRMHFNRYVAKRQMDERARQEAAEEAEHQVVVQETEEEPTAAADAAANGGKRGVKRPAEDEEGGEVKKAAVEEPASLDKVLDEINDELDATVKTEPAPADSEEQPEGTDEPAEAAADKPAIPAPEAAPADQETAAPAAPAATGPNLYVLRPVFQTGPNLYVLRPVFQTGPNLYVLRPVFQTGPSLYVLRPVFQTGSNLYVLRPVFQTGPNLCVVRPLARGVPRGRRPLLPLSAGQRCAVWQTAAAAALSRPALSRHEAAAEDGPRL
ncbi:zinc finger protein on ecdysone puffs-like [Pollicipes pollicipes]|uniref:zinc finger protein on ecdysone puffs-like n=1 Tax=Pollicipes pollicipes TaxID=41117 RepID=UPI00188595AE|nr:zinc finger protein on ecdysone puffs-like [Pollicipes pollicipes]